MNIKHCSVLIGLSTVMATAYAQQTDSLQIDSQQLYTIESVLSTAYQNSPTIRSQELSLERSQQSLNAQRAALKSKFSLDLSPFSYSNQNEYSQDFQEWRNYKNLSSSGSFSISQPILATDGTIKLVDKFGYQNTSLNDATSDNNFSNSVQLQLDQPIFTYNKTKLQLRELELDLENTMLTYSIQKLNLEKNVSQYFYNVYQAQQSLIISQDELKNQQRSYEIIKNKVEAGLSAQEELWQAELNLASAESSVYNAEVSLETAKDNLKQTIGLPLSSDISVLANVEVSPINVDLQEAIDYALKQRMELRTREIEVELSQFNLIKTKETNKFTGNISLTVGLFGENERVNQVYDSPTDNESVSLSLQVPIWDWGQRKSLIKASEASLQSQELNLEQEKIDIELNVRQVYRNLKNLTNQINIAKKSVENAQKTYELKLEVYENGDLTSMDLSLYQNQLSSSKNELTSALINYKLELLNLKIQTLWDFETSKPVLEK